MRFPECIKQADEMVRKLNVPASRLEVAMRATISLLAATGAALVLLPSFAAGDRSDVHREVRREVNQAYRVW